MNKIDSKFDSKGTACSGSLYLPENESNPPVVILCHGLATERTFGLQPYVAHFTKIGLAVFTFDYRNFGDSDGQPRNLINPFRHVADVEAAIEHVKKMQGINTKKMALWGSSFGGGHVLVAAANNADISAVIAQVPFVNGIATTMSFSPSYQQQGVMHGLIDLFKMATFQQAHVVPVIATPDKFALMNTPESFPGYSALKPAGTKWKNEAPARICFTLPSYMPTFSVSKISCPVLFVYAKKDSLIPYKAVEKAAKKVRKAELMALDCGHFDMYAGPLFEEVAEAQGAFLMRNLK